MKIAICDDEQVYREIVMQNAAEYFDRIGFCAQFFTFASGEALLQSAEIFDLVFLDIQMEKLTGIETAERLREKNTKLIVVFMSSFVEYAPEGYRQNAVRFLVKSRLSQELSECLEVVLEEYKKQNEFVLLEQNGAYIKLPVSEIVVVQSALRKISISLLGRDEKIESYMKMDDFCKLLPGDAFIRCHQSFLIAKEYVRKFSPTSCIMANGEEVPISRAKKELVKKQCMITLKRG